MIVTGDAKNKNEIPKTLNCTFILFHFLKYAILIMDPISDKNRHTNMYP